MVVTDQRDGAEDANSHWFSDVVVVVPVTEQNACVTGRPVLVKLRSPCGLRRFQATATMALLERPARSRHARRYTESLSTVPYLRTVFFCTMEKALWYLIAGTRGGPTRARIIRLLNQQPRNANQIATELDVEYNTVRYHLDKLVEHNVVEPGGNEYGELYFLTDQFDEHRDEFETIIETVEDES